MEINELKLEEKLLEEYYQSHSYLQYKEFLQKYISSKLLWIALYNNLDETISNKYKDKVYNLIHNLDDKKLTYTIGLDLGKLLDIIIDELVNRTLKTQKMYVSGPFYGGVNGSYYIKSVLVRLYNEGNDKVDWFDDELELDILVNLIGTLPAKWLINIITSDDGKIDFIFKAMLKNKLTPKDLVGEDKILNRMATILIGFIGPLSYDNYRIILGKLITDYNINVKSLYEHISTKPNMYVHGLKFLDEIVLSQV